jgi:prophage antirepressor-like protein
MNNLKIFKNKEFGNLREDKLSRRFDGSGQRREMTIINESGLYSLILSSKLPTARRFKYR